MDFFTILPAEIRQAILYMVLPDTYVTEHLRNTDLVNLILVSRQVFEDVKDLLSQKPPVFELRYPRRISWTPSRLAPNNYVLPMPRVVRCSIFGNARTDTIFGSSWYTASTLNFVKRWSTHLPEMLPSSIRCVQVDATPAAAFIRKKPPYWTAAMVNDSRVWRLLMPDSQTWIVEFIKQLSENHKHNIQIELVGTYGARNKEWVIEVVDRCREAGIYIDARVEYVLKPPKEPRSHELGDMMSRLTPDSCAPGSTWESRERACRKVRSTSWRQTTKSLFTECLSRDKDWLEEVMCQVVSFLADHDLENHDLPPGDNTQRKLVHRMIDDLGLWTETVGHEPSKFVRVSRVYRPRPWG